MIIRPATIADARRIWEAHVGAIRGSCAIAYTSAQIEAWAGPRKPSDYLGSIASNQMFVAEVDRRVIGFGEFKDTEICAIYVHPEFVRRGAGAALFQQVKAGLRAAGVGKAWLDASLNSVPFYLSMGCTEGNRQTHRLGSGAELPCVRMTLTTK